MSFSQIEKARGYLAQQTDHHRVRPFKEEFLAFLKRHRIPYDERYVFE